jgi:glyoxylase-like metal-dependent hydrolase (beta-lactamase superfamily II)
MNIETYSFTIGDFHCAVVSDGTMVYAPPNFPPPIAFLCANAPKDQLERPSNAQVSEILGLEEWKSSYNCLYIDSGTVKVMVDTGADGLAPTTGKLIPNLRSLGISPSDIDIVILTHGHPDHLGGNVDDHGQPLFPRARWIISKAEWDFWTSNVAEQTLAEHGRDMLIGIARKSLLPLQDKMDLLDGDNEIVPGIRAIAAPGHTPGQITLEISSRREKLLYISDVVVHPVHLDEPGWCVATDVNAADVLASRRKILSSAVAGKTRVMAFHFPFPGLGQIEAKGEAWNWKSI